MDQTTVNIKLMADIADLQRKMRDAQDSVGGAMVNIANSIDGAKASMLNYAKAAAAAFVTGKALEQVKEMAMLNARYQELGVVMGVVGKNAGYNAVEMQNYAAQVQKAGISMIESRNTVIQLSQAQIDLADASKLARIAQDAAVIGNINSSEALQAMIHGIKSAQVDVLRNIGINVSFENSYKDLAKSLGVSKESLSEHQKMLARENAVIEEGIKINGAYEAAMGTAGKQMRSMARYAEDLKVMRGEVFNEALTVGVMAFVDQLKEANAETAKLADNQTLAQWGNDVADVLAFLGDSVATVYATFKSLGDAIGWAAAQLMLLRMPTRNKEEMDQYIAARNAINEESRLRQEGYDKMDSMFSTALAKRRNAQLADAQARLDLEKEYARRSLEVQMAYANQSVEVQRAAQLTLAKNMFPGGLPDKPKLDVGGGDGPKKLSEYQQLIKSIQEKTAADMLDMQTQGSLTAGQKEAVKIMEDLRDGTLKLTQAEKINLTQKLEQRLAVEQQKIAEDAATKQMLADMQARSDARKKEGEAIEAYMLAQQDARHKAEQSAKDELKAAQDRYDQYGKTKSQIEQLVIAELKLKQTRVTADSEEYASLQRQIEMREKLVEVAANTEERERQTSMWQSIEQNAHSTFSNVLQGGQDMWTKLRNTGQAIFVDWLYQLTAKRWLFNIIASVSGEGVANSVMPGMAGSSGRVDGIVNTASNLNTLYGAGSQFLYGNTAGASNASLVYANGTQAVGGDGLGALIQGNGGWAGVSTEGAAASAPSTGALSGAGSSAMAFIPLLLAAYGANKDSFRVSSTGDSTSQFDASGRVINRRNQLFGGDSPISIPSIVNGVAVANPQTPSSFTTNELALTDGHTQEQLDTLYAAQSATRDAHFAATNAAADKYTEGLNAAYLQAAKNLGVGAVGTNITFGTNDTRGGGGARLGLSAGSKMFDSGDITLNDADLQLAANRAILTALEGSDLPKWMQGVFDGVDAATLDQAGIDAAIKSATDLRDAYNMLQQIPGTDLTGISFETLNSIKGMAAELVTVNTAFYQFGYTMLDVSAQGAQAAADLVNAFGGLQAAQAQLNSFAQNYLTADEQQASTYAIVQSNLQKAGITVTVDQLRAATRQEIRAAVDSLSGGANTTEGAAQYAAAVQAANTLASLKPTLDAVAAVPASVQQVGSSGWGVGVGGVGGVANNAMTDLRRALEALADTIHDLRADIIMAGPDSFAQLKAQFAIEAAMADAGDLTAKQDLPELARALAEAGKANTRDRQEQSLLTGYIIDTLARVGGLSTGGNMLSVPSFDVGTNRVPRDMLAMLHKDEAVQPAAYNPAVGGVGYSGGGDEAVARAISSLNTRLGKIEANTKFSEKLYDLFLPAVDGEKLQVVVVEV